MRCASSFFPCAVIHPLVVSALVLLVSSLAVSALGLLLPVWDLWKTSINVACAGRAQHLVVIAASSHMILPSLS